MRYASSSYGEGGRNTMAAIRNLEDFDAGNMHASRPYGASRKSRLPRGWLNDYHADLARRKILYEVRSWDTPIAWFVEGHGWVFPAIGYSAFTSLMQSLVRRALDGLEMRTTVRREHMDISIDWDWEVSE